MLLTYVHIPTFIYLFFMFVFVWSWVDHADFAIKCIFDKSIKQIAHKKFSFKNPNIKIKTLSKTVKQNYLTKMPL